MKLNLSAASIAGLSTAVLTTALVSYAPSANAASINGTDGSWSNIQGGSYVTTGTADGFRQVRWGDPAYHSNPTWRDQSGLGFRGVGQTDIQLNQIFRLGTLQHYNETIWGGTAASSADLGISLDFANIGVKNFNFNLQIDETPNVAGTCAYYSDTACSDKISWSNQYASESFSHNGKQYTLQLDGFRETAGGALVNHFISQEGGTSQAHLFGSIVQVPTEEVPEPLTMMGSAVALGFGGMFQKKRNAKKSAK
jgi:hypothetical protein